MTFAIICRQGAVRSAYVAAKLRQRGVRAESYGARPDDNPVHPFTMQRAAARGVLLGHHNTGRWPAKSYQEIPREDRKILLDERYVGEIGRSGFIPVLELDITGMTREQAYAAIDSYLDTLDAISVELMRKAEQC